MSPGFSHGECQHKGIPGTEDIKSFISHSSFLILLNVRPKNDRSFTTVIDLPYHAFYRRIDSIADGNAEDIQNQVVNIRRPGSKGQLKDLNA